MPDKPETPFDDITVFAIKATYYYKGPKIDTLNRDQLLALLKKVLKKETLK